MADPYVCQEHRPGTLYTFADVAILNSPGTSEEAGAACHKRPAPKGLPERMDMCLGDTFADLAWTKA